MKIYGHPMSTCTRKVLMTLAEKGHKAEFVLVDLMTGAHKNADFLARQPFGQVPALDDDGFSLYESRAMIRYIDAKVPGPALTPPELQGRALMEQWISVETSNFTPIAMKIIGQIMFSKLHGKEPDMAIVEQAKKDIVKPLAIMDRALAGKEHLVGAFSLADIGFMPYIEYLYGCGVGAELLEPHKNVNAWWQRISSRPTWKQVTAK